MNGRGHGVFATSGLGVILLYGFLGPANPAPRLQRQAFPGRQFPAHV
jgi:hypothetical protein